MPPRDGQKATAKPPPRVQQLAGLGRDTAKQHNSERSSNGRPWQPGAVVRRPPRALLPGCARTTVGQPSSERESELCAHALHSNQSRYSSVAKAKDSTPVSRGFEPDPCPFSHAQGGDPRQSAAHTTTVRLPFRELSLSGGPMAV